MSELNPFHIAQHQLDEAAKTLRLDDAMHELLRWPMREYRPEVWAPEGRP